MRPLRASSPQTLPADESARTRDAFVADVQYYLIQHPRQLPSRYLYDDLGSALFEAICRLPWYPITRAERRLLAEHGAEILRRVRPAALVELGSGSGEKLRLFLEAAETDVPSVHLVDLSAAALDQAARTLAPLERLTVTSHEATYEAGLEAAARTFPEHGRALALFLGSNIGNFDRPSSEAFLRDIHRELRQGDALLLGADLVKSSSAMQVAYDDPLGVTAAFNRNLLVRINRELDADFDLNRFLHRAVWNEEASRIEMHLIARGAQTIRIAAAELELDMADGEPIWTESSYKYRRADVARLLEAGGFRVTGQWVDARDPFALTLAEAV